MADLFDFLPEEPNPTRHMLMPNMGLACGLDILTGARIAKGSVERPVPYDGRPHQAEIEEAADYAHYLAEGEGRP